MLGSVWACSLLETERPGKPVNEPLNVVMRALRRGAVVAVLISVLLPGVLAAPAPLRFERLAVEEGLSQSAVNCILQDSQGFMWFGTEDGLNRFDGYSFEVFYHDESDPDTLSRNYIWTLLEDRAGRLWVGTESGGLDLWEPSTGRFLHHRATGANGLTHDTVRALAEDRQGNLWIATDGGGLNRYSPDTGAWRSYRHAPDDPESLSHDPRTDAIGRRCGSAVDRDLRRRTEPARPG